MICDFEKNNLTSVDFYVVNCTHSKLVIKHFQILNSQRGLRTDAGFA